MPKIGRTLSYINTERKGKSTEQSSVTQSLGSSRPGGTVSMPQGDYLLKSIWDKVFEIRTDSQGIEYIFGKLPMVTQYGITMYSGDGVDIPSLASGLPFDGRTIWYNPDTQQIEVIGGTGGGSGEGVSNFWDLSGIPSWITNSKPKYTYSEIEGTPDLTQYALVSQIPSLSGYATESWVTQQNYATKATTLSGYGITDAYTKTNVDELLKTYVTLGGTQTITGEKNFTGGLKVNGSPIVYDSTKKYWKLEGDLLVTGGVTMYGNEGTYTPSTIMNAILYDETTLGINSNGQLYVKGGTSGGGLDITALQNYLTQNSYLNVTSGDNRYLKLSGGTIDSSVFYGLRINSKDSSVNRSAIAFLYDDSNKSQFGWDGYSSWGTFMYNYPSSSYLGIKDNGTLVFNDNTLIHSGNYSQYALPLSGGTITGTLEIKCGADNKIVINNTDGEGYSRIVFQENGSYIGQLLSTKDGNIHWGGSKIWHSGNFNPSNYLPLSGGTIKSDDVGLTITRTTQYPIISFYGGGTSYQSFYGALGFGGANTPVYVDNTGGNIYNLWHAGNLNPSNYLPLSGGTMTGNILLGGTTTNKIGTNIVDTTSWQEFTHQNSHGYIAIGPFNASVAHIYTDRPSFYFNKDLYVNNAKVWNAGNDGSGSGLDADTLDGYHVTHFMSYVKGSGYVQANLLNSELWNIAGGDGYIEYYDNGTWFNSRWGKVMAHYGFEGSLSGNASSATKLQTARTIWGQSFDGMGNVSGTLSGVDGITFNSYNAVSVDYNSNFVFKYPNTTALQDWSIQKQDTTKIFMVRNDGNVGIGTTSPQQKLHVEGHLWVNGDIGAKTKIHSFGNLIVNGNVGIGTESPISKCDIYGLLTVRTESSTSKHSSLNLMNTSSDLWQLSARYGSAEGGHFNIYYYNGSTWAKPISINKNGNLLSTGGITMYSDQRKKTILNHVELSLKQIAEAPLIEHYYNSDEKKTTHVGSIAQYWASMNDWFCKLDSEGYYTMEIQNAALASAISIARELDRYETKTDKAIKKLKKRISELEEEIERLKSA